MRGANLQFVVDKQPPRVAISGIKENGRYSVEEQIVTIIPTDDGGELKNLAVKITDSDDQIVRLRDDTGNELKTEWSGDELVAGGKHSITIPESTKSYSVSIICTDRSQNSSGETNTFEKTIQDITVSTKWYVLYFANKALLYGSTGGIFTLGAGAAMGVIIRKRKSKPE